MRKFKSDMVTIWNGDCIDVLKKFRDESVDMVFTSPPYDSLRTYDGFDWNEGVWKRVIKDLYRVLKKRGVMVWVVGDATIDGSETGTSFKQALYAKECGFNLHDTMIYQKSGVQFPEINRYYLVFEYMFVFSKGKPGTYNLLRDRMNSTAGDIVHGKERQVNGSINVRSGARKCRIIKPYGVRFNIWQYGTGMGNSYKEKYLKEHPAILNPGLVRDHILSWSNKGDVVLDPFMGSGTTMVVARQLERLSIGIEISEKYCELAVRRLNDN